MKHLKQNDGYVLPYVMIVFLVLSFVAVTICSMSLTNLRAQEEAVKRTKVLYETEGLVERFAAELAAMKVTTPADYPGESAAKDAAKDVFKEQAIALAPEVGADQLLAEWDGTALIVTAKSADGTVQVTAKIAVTLDLAARPNGAEGDDVRYTGSASVESNGLKYESYDISRSAAADVPEQDPPEGGEGA